jgi:hypothetical protein
MPNVSAPVKNQTGLDGNPVVFMQSLSMQLFEFIIKKIPQHKMLRVLPNIKF